MFKNLNPQHGAQMPSRVPNVSALVVELETAREALAAEKVAHAVTKDALACATAKK